MGNCSRGCKIKSRRVLFGRRMVRALVRHVWLPLVAFVAMGKCVAVPEGNCPQRVAVVCPVTGRAALLSVAARLLCSLARIFSHIKMGRRKNVQVLARLLEVGERRLAEGMSRRESKICSSSALFFYLLMLSNINCIVPILYFP